MKVPDHTPPVLLEETEMRVRSVVLVALLSPAIAFAVKPDKPGCKDHALFPTRMPTYYIAACEAKEFASWPFKLQKGKTHAVEGKYTFITYAVDDRKDDQTGVAAWRSCATTRTP